MILDRDIKVFRQAARQHLISARILYRNQAFADAVYLAGYTVECGLKALLLSRTAVGQRSRLKSTFRGSTAHNLLALRNALVLRHVIFGHDLSPAFRKVSTWSTELRYKVGRIAAEDAEEFIAAVSLIDGWIERSLP